MGDVHVPASAKHNDSADEDNNNKLKYFCNFEHPK